jgi:transglutaminase-like putative cysteine protease
MHLIPASDTPADYLAPSPVIDYEDQAIRQAARRLSANADSDDAIIQACYEFVRDEISHTFDIGASEVTCAASEVLRYGHGTCYAKSHLLAAILRCLGIPAGFCYQKLRDADSPSRYALHGLNAVYFSSLGRWVRMDARGNKPYVSLRFNPGSKMLAYQVNEIQGESEDRMIFATPAESVIRALTMCTNAKMLSRSLPDAY